MQTQPLYLSSMEDFLITSAGIIAADYAAAGFAGAETPATALAGARLVFSVVTADQALAAARSAAACDLGGTVYFDCNSCAPGTKRKSAEVIEAAGGRYVDTAVMAAVGRTLHKTPLLLSGPHAYAGLAALSALGMRAQITPGAVGAASSIKMIRSIMIKGLEALTLECILAGRRAGVDEEVLSSLEVTFPGLRWKEQSAYMMERAMTHGIRRAAEMREVAVTVEELGLRSAMSGATVVWEQAIGDLGLDAGTIGPADYTKLADALLTALETDTK